MATTCATCTSILRPILSLTLTLCLVLPAGLEARVEPTSGFDIFSQDEEIQLGKENAAQVMKQLPVLLERYGAAVANQPTARAARTAVNSRRDFGASPVAESK